MTDLCVSVIVPLYNGARFLAETIESAAGQSYRPLEVVVVDDGSTDQSAQIVAEAQQRLDLPLFYYYQDNQGPSVARNVGIQMAQGEIIAFLDADDLWMLEKVTRQVDYLLEHKEDGGVVCRTEYFLEPGTEWPPTLNRDVYDQSPTAFIPSALTVWRTAFEQVGPFDPTLRTGEDTDWFFRARDAGTTIGVVPEILLRRRFHQTNLSYTPVSPVQDMLSIIRASLKRRSK